MQKFFGIQRATSEALVSMPEWKFARDGLLKNLGIVTNYYRRFASRIDSSHFLIRLIYSSGISRGTPIERYYDYLQQRFSGITMVNQMTSSVSKGQVFDGVFYGPKVKEVIIGHNESFDPFDAETNWEKLTPIKVLHHPISDLSMQIPDGTESTTDEGIAVIAINIPMLVIQYREFRKQEEARCAATGENPKNDGQFLYNYPLTNMMASHLDVAVFNRIYNRLSRIPPGTLTRRHPFFMNNYDSVVDRVQGQVLDAISKKNSQGFNAILKTVPLVSQENLYTFAELPDMAHTRQVAWGLVLARMQLISFLFEASENDPREANAMEVNRIARVFQLYNTDKALQSSLPVNLYYDMKATIDQVIHRQLQQRETATDAPLA